jgi:hypothetical protein
MLLLRDQFLIDDVIEQLALITSEVRAAVFQVRMTESPTDILTVLNELERYINGKLQEAKRRVEDGH